MKNQLFKKKWTLTFFSLFFFGAIACSVLFFLEFRLLGTTKLGKPPPKNGGEAALEWMWHVAIAALIIMYDRLFKKKRIQDRQRN